MVTLDFSKCKTKEDVTKVFKENRTELALINLKETCKKLEVKEADDG